MNPGQNPDPWAAVPATRAHLDAAKAVDDLARALAHIEANDTNYNVRYGLVLDAIAAAHRAGYPAGFGIDHSPGPAMDGYRVVAYVELPGGRQVSWHLPEHPTPWDGHTTPEKYARINGWLADVLPF